MLYPSGLPPHILDLAEEQHLQAFLEQQRYEIPKTEVRRWDEGKRFWIPFAWETSRNSACIIAGAVHRILDWKCQVWSLDGWCDPSTGRWQTREPVMCDLYPDRWIRGGEPFNPSCSPVPDALALEWEEWRCTLRPYELRSWYERPPRFSGTPSQWDTCGWTHDLHEAREIAGALRQERNWQMQIWYLDPNERENRWQVD